MQQSSSLEWIVHMDLVYWGHMTQVSWFAGSGRDRGPGLKTLTVYGTVDKRLALIVGCDFKNKGLLLQ